MPRSYSLRSRLALIAGLMTAALSWILGTLMALQASQFIRHDTGTHLVTMTQSVLENLEHHVQEFDTLLTAVAQWPQWRTSGDGAGERLAELTRRSDALQWIGFVDMAGKVLAASTISGPTSLAAAPGFEQAVNGQKLITLPLGNGLGLGFAALAEQVKDDAGRPLGILVALLSRSSAAELTHTQLIHLHNHGPIDLVVLDPAGQVLVGSESLGEPIQTMGKLDTFTQGDHGWAVIRWPDENQYLSAASVGKHWRVVARQAIHQVYAPVRQLLLTVVLWGGVLAVLAAFFTWLACSRITTVLTTLREGAERISAGQSDELPLIDGAREFSYLSRALHQMVERLMLRYRALGAQGGQTHQDPLTGLPNRVALEKYLPRLQQGAELHPQSLTLLYVDLLDFGAVNKQYGHQAGNEALYEVAQRLKGTLRDGDMVARLGGDEFLMILRVSDQDARSQAQQIAERIIERLQAPVEVEQAQVQLGCCIGGALWPLDDAELDQVLQYADNALRVAKRRGKNQYQFHDEA